ncbi:MAG: hypothetical protein H6799_00985 [Candidatus Nomurabacteria bacterium]|nr:MAG: hypothetical protein H6799_00985 [Candidatus Nomurabacteria bacterium]HRV76188.1 hypothetical protein [Candidatus Saccharimonadales bacterium]
MTPVSDDSTAQTTTAQADVNDDLAKALASVQASSQSSTQPADDSTGQEMNFETVGEPVMSGAPVMSAPPVAPVAPVSPMPTYTPTVDSSNQEVEYSTPPASIDHTQDYGSASAGSSADSIEQIKISALQQLRPLMQHIELTPEEKFEKYLMMLRASDDQDLIQPTYEAAQMISSEKLKAQALLDVINEINYLTSQQLVN